MIVIVSVYSKKVNTKKKATGIPITLVLPAIVAFMTMVAVVGL